VFQTTVAEIHQLIHTPLCRVLSGQQVQGAMAVVATMNLFNTNSSTVKFGAVSLTYYFPSATTGTTGVSSHSTNQLDTSLTSTFFFKPT
jgi:hypothetical protein